MKQILLVTLMGMAFAGNSLFAQMTQTLSLDAPDTWTPGTTINLSVTDTFSGYGSGGSFGLSYWLEIPAALAGCLTITNVVHHTFTDGGIMGAFPWSFGTNSGADPNYLTTTAANGGSTDLGATSMNPVANGTYKITDITIVVGPNCPAGTYMICTTQLPPRVSTQVTSDFGDAAIPQACKPFTIVPEPSTLALLLLASVGAAVAAFRRITKAARAG